MKTRRTKTKKPARRTAATTGRRTPTRAPKEPTLLEKIAEVTEELQTLRSRLANAGDSLTTIGTHRISSLESELERLWEMRRREQAAPLRESSLTEEEEKVLAFPSGARSRGT